MPESRAPCCDRCRVEFLRIGDAGKADHRQHAEPSRIAARRHARLQYWLVRRLEGFGERRRLAAIADQQQGVGARHLLVERRAQRSRRHDEPIAEPDAAVHHDQAEILDELRVLEAVIHDDDGCVGALDQLGACRAVRRDDGRRMRVQAAASRRRPLPRSALCRRGPDLRSCRHSLA